MRLPPSLPLFVGMERKEMEEEKKVMEGKGGGGVIMHRTMEEEKEEKVMEGKGGIIDRTMEEEVEEVEEEEEEEEEEIQEKEEVEEVEEEEEEEEIQEKEKVMEGIASIALLPCGSISGHFIQLPGSVCYGLQGTELACERECSRGEDYRLIKLTIMDYSRKRERVVVVECRGHDAARFQNVDQAHGWEKDVVGMVEKKHAEHKISVSFECETLKADKAAEDHIKQFMPNVSGLDAVVNVGRMSIAGLDFEAEGKLEETQD